MRVRVYIVHAPIHAVAGEPDGGQAVADTRGLYTSRGHAWRRVGEAEQRTRGARVTISSLVHKYSMRRRERVTPTVCTLRDERVRLREHRDAGLRAFGASGCSGWQTTKLGTTARRPPTTQEKREHHLARALLTSYSNFDDRNFQSIAPATRDQIEARYLSGRERSVACATFAPLNQRDPSEIWNQQRQSRWRSWKWR
jgi:hypothetical protein